MGRPKKDFPESGLEELNKVFKYGLNQADTAAYFDYSSSKKTAPASGDGMSRDG